MSMHAHAHAHTYIYTSANSKVRGRSLHIGLDQTIVIHQFKD